MATKVYKLITAKQRVICDKMIVATDLFERMLGLMFSKELPNCDGFLIKPCNSIHTFFMLYPIDVVFLDKNFKVINVIRNLKPWRMTGIYFKSSMVLELQGGTLLNDVTIGDQLEAVCIS